MASAFTLIEVAVAFAISVLLMAGMFRGYTMASRRAQFSSFQLAAQAMAMQQMESIVAATWVISGTSVTNIFSPSLTRTQTNALGVPSSGTNLVYGTNYATVTQISTDPPYVMVQVSCVWNFMGMGTFTNTVAALRSPDL
jgi:type II secretory pathway pseudopilin PulG